MKRNLLIMIIVLVLGIIVGFGSFYLYTNDNNSDECPKCDECVNDNNSGKYYILKNDKYVESKVGKENINRYASYYEAKSFKLFAYDKKMLLESNSNVYSDYVFSSRIVNFCDSPTGVYILLENGDIYDFAISYDLTKKLTESDFKDNLSKINVKPIFQIVDMEVPSKLTGVDSVTIKVGYGYDGNYYELEPSDSDYKVYDNVSVGDDNID